MKLGLGILLAWSGAFAANSITIVSAASGDAGLAPESLASAFGVGMTVQIARADAVPWPTALGGITAQVTDSASVSRPAGLLFVSPAQINLQIPAGTAPGPATLAIHNGPVTLSSQVQIQPVAPALFVINSRGVAAASAIRMVISTRIQSPLPVFSCGLTAESCRTTPLDVGVDAPVFVSFYGTGIRGRSSLDKVSVRFGNTTVAAMYAGPQPQVPGLDQVNVPLPIGLRGSGEIEVILTVDGISSNVVKIAVR